MSGGEHQQAQLMLRMGNLEAQDLLLCPSCTGESPFWRSTAASLSSERSCEGIPVLPGWDIDHSSCMQENKQANLSPAVCTEVTAVISNANLDH